MWSVVIATTLAVQASGDLVAAATSSGRPPACVNRPTMPEGTASVWSRAHVPHLQAYCRHLARAQMAIVRAPKRAAREAEQARKLWPGRAAPLVVLARLASRAKDHQRAVETFRLAQKRDPRALDQPLAMLDYARALAHRGETAAAFAAYRLLVPRASLLPDRNLRAEALLEAGLLAIASHARRPDPDLLRDAFAYLREGQRDPFHRLHGALRITIALAHELRGQSARADALLADRRGIAGDDPLPAHVTDPHLAAVLAAFRREVIDPARARAAYEAVAQGGEVEVFRKAAASRLGRLASRPRPRPR